MINADKIIKHVKSEGYMLLPQVYDITMINKLLTLCKESYEITKNKIPEENIAVFNKEQPGVYNLQNKDFYFLEALFHFVEIEEVLKYFLNDKWYKPIPPENPNYILRGYHARSNSKGLPLHIDSYIPYHSKYVFSVQLIIALEDQHIENGCTLVVPGSHLYGEYANQEALQNAIPIESKAGDVVIFDSRLWHGTADNISGKSRWALTVTFIRWWIKQQYDIPRGLPQQIYEKLSDKHKAILGFCSISPKNEFEGADMKTGYEKLKTDVNLYN